MSIDYKNGLDFSQLLAKTTSALPEALKAGGEVIRVDAVDKVPKETGDLASTAQVDAGHDAAEIRFTSVYSRYIHEHLEFKHPHGGQAKFLESALLEKKDEALAEVARVVREAL